MKANNHLSAPKDHGLTRVSGQLYLDLSAVKIGDGVVLDRSELDVYIIVSISLYGYGAEKRYKGVAHESRVNDIGIDEHGGESSFEVNLPRGHRLGTIKYGTWYESQYLQQVIRKGQPAQHLVIGDAKALIDSYPVDVLSLIHI